MIFTCKPKYPTSDRHAVYSLPGDLRGFTLIELIVVIAVIGMLFFLTLPKFRDALLMDPKRKVSIWIMGTTKTLRENAFREQKRYAFHLGLDTNTLWTSDESMDEDAVLAGADQGYELPDGFRLLDVTFAEDEKIVSGRGDIYFFPQGYSDKALIHLETDNAETVTFAIEPFLPDVVIFERYAEFDD